MATRIRRVINEARDPANPVDPGRTIAREVNPTSQLPDSQGQRPPLQDLENDQYVYWLTDLGTAARGDEHGATEIFSDIDGKWKIHYIPGEDLFPSSAEEVAGLIGGRQRLTEPSDGVTPLRSPPEFPFAPDELEPLAEADSSADQPTEALPSLPDLPEGPMNEREIRAAGLRLDLPYEAPMPKEITYKDLGPGHKWTPPPGWEQTVDGSGSDSGG